MKDNDGIVAKIILVIVFLVPIVAMFIPGNSAFIAPIGNKIGFGVAYLIFFFMAYNVWNDNWTWINSPAYDKPLQWIATVIVLIVALLVLLVFHSGPLGLTTNNI